MKSSLELESDLVEFVNFGKLICCRSLPYLILTNRTKITEHLCCLLLDAHCLFAIMEVDECSSQALLCGLLLLILTTDSSSSKSSVFKTLSTVLIFSLLSTFIVSNTCSIHVSSQMCRAKPNHNFGSFFVGQNTGDKQIEMPKFWVSVQLLFFPE